MMLVEKNIAYSFCPANPFNDPPDAPLPALTRFARIPVLRHGAFVVSETRAILSYLDHLKPGKPMRPTDPRVCARSEQVMGILDAYGYWPLVRQVFAHRVFRPLEGLEADEAEVARGLADARPVLDALNDIVAEGLVLNMRGMTLADIYLAPMLDYFAMAGEGRAMLSGRGDLKDWLDWVRTTRSFRETVPDFTKLPR